MTPKHILITGSTDGIGREAAISLAEEGHTIYIHGRNREKIENVKNEIHALTGREVIGFLADFSELRDVQNMILQIRNQVPKIDVLINNAGVYNSPTPKNSQGIDLRFQVNYISPYMLTHRILQVLDRSDAPRIINVSSAAQSPVDLEALEGQLDIPEPEAYAQSKLAMIMWTFDMASWKSLYTIITVNPGSLLDTKMAHEAFGKSWSPSEKGAKILHDLAVDTRFADASGQYFDNDAGEFRPAHPDAYDPTKIQAVIDMTDSIVQA